MFFLKSRLMTNKLRIMKSSSLALIIATACLAAAECAQGAVPVVYLEKTKALGETWQEIHAGNLSATPEGGLMDGQPDNALNDNSSNVTSVFYRLRIQTTDASGIPTGFSLNEDSNAVSKEALAIAQEHLSSCQEEDWENAELGPVVYPVYNPAINGGNSPAYLEFKVIRKAVEAGSTAPFNSPLLAQKADRGFLLVSLTHQDVPIPAFSTDGLTQVEKLRNLAKTSQVKAVRYCQSILVAENAKGEAVANLGGTPVQYPEEILDFSTNRTVSMVENGQIFLVPDRPNFTGTAYTNYAQFKDDYLNGPLYPKLRAFQALSVKMDWMFQDDILPDLIEVGENIMTNILASKSIARFAVEEPEIVDLQLVPGKPWLNATGLTPGGTILHIFYAGGGGDSFLIRVGPPAQQALGLGHWGNWSTYNAGDWWQQKLYTQIRALPGCCPDGYSGCGATAWAMFYGYWDAGVANLINGFGITPVYNNSDVNSCIQYLFNQIGTYCSGSAGATNPWDMDEGYKWALHQQLLLGGVNMTITTDWCVPYLGYGPRNQAIRSIKEYGHPAIVGTGYYAHYPLAYAYKCRNYYICGVNLNTERYWKVNNGWGETRGTWVNVTGCWFGSNGYCY